MEALEDDEYRKGEAFYKDVQEQFRAASNNITKDIERWYKRLADNNGISLEDAKKLLKDNELAEFKWDVNQYIKAGYENAIDQRWMKELENASARYHISYLESMKLQIRQHCELLSAQYEGGLTDFLHKIYADDFYKTAFEVQKGMGVGVNLAQLDTNKIDKVITKPWAADGKSFSSRIWENKQKLVGNLHNELSQCLIRGEEPEKAVKRLAEVMGVNEAQARRLVMTELSAVDAMSKRDTYKALGIKEFEVIATLDSKTSDICRGMDGKHFKTDDFEIGVTANPFHPHCRTTTAPYFEDDFDEPGERAARGSDGKTYHIPSNITYKEWKKRFVDVDNSGLQNETVNDTINPMVIDITKAFIENSSAGGRIVFEGNYDKRTHSEEIKTAEWLQQSFGGNVVLLSEVKAKDIKTHDCIWDGKDWEFKTVASDKFTTIDSRIRKAYAQISDNRGGIVLDFTDSSLTLDEAVEMVKKSSARRMKGGGKIIVKKGERFKVFNIPKEKE